MTQLPGSVKNLKTELNYLSNLTLDPDLVVKNTKTSVSDTSSLPGTQTVWYEFMTLTFMSQSMTFSFFVG